MLTSWDDEPLADVLVVVPGAWEVEGGAPDLLAGGCWPCCAYIQTLQQGNSFFYQNSLGLHLTSGDGVGRARFHNRHSSGQSVKHFEGWSKRASVHTYKPQRVRALVSHAAMRMRVISLSLSSMPTACGLCNGWSPQGTSICSFWTSVARSTANLKWLLVTS